MNGQIAQVDKVNDLVDRLLELVNIGTFWAVSPRGLLLSEDALTQLVERLERCEDL